MSLKLELSVDYQLQCFKMEDFCHLLKNVSDSDVSTERGGLIHYLCGSTKKSLDVSLVQILGVVMPVA